MIFLNPIFLFLVQAGNIGASVFYPIAYLHGAIMFLFIQQGWEDSNPNEWLLIIEKGKMINAGVGLRTYRYWYQTAVRFPSSIKKVQFSAMQVTQEMQGVEIKGIAIWGVDRTVQNEGPFKYYKNMTNAQSDTNVRTMCESVVRHIISNTELDMVLRDRENLRDRMKKELQQQLSGWGVWLETVEVTDVRICSRSLFEDMQARFKQDEFLKAEKIRLETNNKIDSIRMTSDIALQQQIEKQTTDRTKLENSENLKRTQQDFEFYSQNLENKIQRIEQEKINTLQDLQNQHDIEKQRLIQQLEIQKLQFLSSIQEKKQQLELENSMSDKNFQKYSIDKTKSILQRLPLENFRINNYLKPEESGLLSFLPGISEFYKQLDKPQQGYK